MNNSERCDKGYIQGTELLFGEQCKWHKLQAMKNICYSENVALCFEVDFCIVNCVTCSLINFSRSSLSSWSVGSQEAALQDVDYISFLFSTLTGFSSDKLTSLQEADDESILPPSPLSPLSLYPTPLEHFTHHWDVVEVRSLHTIFPTITPHLTNILTRTEASADQKYLKMKLEGTERGGEGRGRKDIVLKIEKC